LNTSTTRSRARDIFGSLPLPHRPIPPCPIPNPRGNCALFAPMLGLCCLGFLLCLFPPVSIPPGGLSAFFLSLVDTRWKRHVCILLFPPDFFSFFAPAPAPSFLIKRDDGTWWGVEHWPGSRRPLCPFNTVDLRGKDRSSMSPHFFTLRFELNQMHFHRKIQLTILKPWLNFRPDITPMKYVCYIISTKRKI